MSDLSQLLIGGGLVLLSIGAWIACLPRGGKTRSFVTMPFLAPAVSVVIIGCFAMGLILVAAYFTTIDDATLSGKKRSQAQPAHMTVLAAK
ncbi:MAG: hypothetical protein ABI830_10570 [Pseudolabrys sp.]